MIGRARPERSLRGRALALLARREHSPWELRRKLAPHAESAEALDALLAALEREKLLSADRFVESLVHRRSPGFGTARIRQELQSHALPRPLVEAATASLRDGELARARDVWARRFGVVATDPRERARQQRFLAQRGFSIEVIRRVVQSGDDD